MLNCPWISKLHTVETCGKVNLQIQSCLIWTPNRSEWSASPLTALRSRQEVFVTLKRKLYILHSRCTSGDSELSTGNRTQSSRVFTNSIYLSVYATWNYNFIRRQVSVSYKPPSGLFLRISAKILTANKQEI